MSSINWIENFNKFEITTDTGTDKRGKYTLPNTLALATNVFEVAVRQDEK